MTPSERRRAPGRRREDQLAGLPFEEAFIALTDGVILTDAAGSISSANPAAFRLLGEDALLGRAFEELLLVSGAAPVQESGTHLVRRAWFPREGRMGVLEIVSTNIPAPAHGAIHTVRDVTAQAELLRLKEDFLLQVAHELRTPIASLSASLDLLQQDALSMPRHELARMVDTLRRSALRLEHLVENLLDSGSIEAGTFQVRTVPMSLRHALEESLTFVGPLLDSKGQRLDVRFARAADRVVGDPRRTAQVFANLLANASKYAPEGSTVTCGSTEGGGFVRVTVTDEGPGIPDDEQARLFERFFRSREVRDQAGGLGLGLAICRAIVHAHGGDISVESAAGRGTSVHFTLPKARELAEEAEEG
ncbi:MAG TPA: PAS domain-containing sensor histidine kinase [Candidatus Limnocylindrales bacterium]|nr:PAS domain-containing sensor histidine kinase [Candidatus Limnocylindrales bacterium]